MIELLKKYRFNIIVVLVLTGLLFFFIPNEEGHYLQPDLKEIKDKSHFLILWTVGILIGVLFLFGSRTWMHGCDIFLFI
jgi:hypothetical protein